MTTSVLNASPASSGNRRLLSNEFIATKKHKGVREILCASCASLWHASVRFKIARLLVLAITVCFLALTPLKVERTWKEVESEQVTVFTPAGDHACGYNFEVGQSYLVYASSTNDGELWTNHCTRTQRIAADIDNDLKFLGKGKRPKKTNQPH